LLKGILGKNDGYILAWVLCIFLVVSVACTAVISSSMVSTSSTTTEHNAQQAYYTAKSAASAVSNYIVNNSADTTLINRFINNQGSGSVSDMGTYTVVVTSITSEKLQVKATAQYKNESATVTSYLIKPPATAPVKIPTDHVVFVNGSGASGFGQCSINGNVYVNGDLNLSQSSSISGFVIVKGNTEISGYGSTTNGMFGYGNVTLLGSGAVNGDVYTKGTLNMGSSNGIRGSVYADKGVTFTNSGSIDGDVYITKGDLNYNNNGNIKKNAYVDGSLSMPNGLITGNANISNNATFSGGGIKIMGKLTHGGIFTKPSWATVSTYVNSYSNINPDLKILPVDDTPYKMQTLPTVSIPASGDLYNVLTTEDVSTNVISKSGKITSTIVNSWNSRSMQGQTITIDATTNNISLLLDNTNLNLTNNVKIEVNSDGTHFVYIYLKGTSSISIDSNEYIGMKVRGSNPCLFIIGDGTQTVSLTNNSAINACVYIPDGTFNASGSNLDNTKAFKFVGSCIVKTVNISSGVSLYYSPPIITGSDHPLAALKSGTGGSAWKLESWGSN